jgi:DNA mismatch repair protein MutS
MQRGSGAVGQQSSRRDGELDTLGIASVDLSTGEFVLESVPHDRLDELLSRLAPAEVVISTGDIAPLPRSSVAPLVTPRDPWEFDPELAREDLCRRLGLASLDGLGIGSADELALGAAGALLRYLSELQPGGLSHLARPFVRRSDQFLWLDEMTRRNLELVDPLRAGARGCTLLEVIDAT